MSSQKYRNKLVTPHGTELIIISQFQPIRLKATNSAKDVKNLILSKIKKMTFKMNKTARISGQIPACSDSLFTGLK